MPKESSTFQKMPYESTKISPEETKGDIERLLKQFGIRDYQWTVYKGVTQLKFIYRIQIDGNEKEVAFLFKPPVMMAMKRTYNTKMNRYEKINVPLEAVSYRLLWHYLKTKLEAVTWGLESVEKEFMSHIIMLLPSGEETTMGEALNKKALGTVGNNIFALQDISKQGDKTEC